MARLRQVFFVDAGYLREIGARASNLSADQVQLAPVALINWIRQVAAQGNFHLLRTYVYDGRFDSEHPRAKDQKRHLDELDDIPGIRVRLGTLVHRGKRGLQQKGVDTALVIDLLQMAQLNAFDIAVLFAGDADFAEAVDVVQRFGRQVMVVRVDPPDAQLAKVLRQAADDYIWITTGNLRNLVVELAPSPPSTAP